MSAYLISLCAGILIGVVYALFRVRSPAPPGIALVGLLGMVLGERLAASLHERSSAEPGQYRHYEPHVHSP